MTDKKTIKAVKPAKEVKTIVELHADLNTKQNDLIDAKRGHKAGELVNPRAIATLRKEIARLHTAIRADELTTIKENK